MRLWGCIFISLEVSVFGGGYRAPQVEEPQNKTMVHLYLEVAWANPTLRAHVSGSSTCLHRRWGASQEESTEEGIRQESDRDLLGGGEKLLGAEE